MGVTYKLAFAGGKLAGTAFGGVQITNAQARDPRLGAGYEGRGLLVGSAVRTQPTWHRRSLFSGMRWMCFMACPPVLLLQAGTMSAKQNTPDTPAMLRPDPSRHRRR